MRKAGQCVHQRWRSLCDLWHIKCSSSLSRVLCGDVQLLPFPLDQHRSLTGISSGCAATVDRIWRIKYHWTEPVKFVLESQPPTGKR